MKTSQFFDLILDTVKISIRAVPNKEQAKFTNRLIDEISDFYDSIRQHKKL